MLNEVVAVIAFLAIDYSLVPVGDRFSAALSYKKTA